MNIMETNEKEFTGYPSIDKPWLQYYKEDDLKHVAEHNTIYQNIYSNNYKYPDDVALIYYGRSISYKEFFEKIELTKQAFLKMGVKEGDNIAFLILSCPEMIYSILALNQIGACANMVNPTFTAEQIRDRINDSEASLILILDQLYGRIESVMKDICPKTKIIVPLKNSMPLLVKTITHFKSKKKIEKTSDTVLWNDFIKSAIGEVRTCDYVYKDNMSAVMVYSSGTTGASKGIVLTNDGINGTIAHYDNSEYEFNRGDKFLHIGAPWLSTSLVVCFLMPLQKGISVIIEPLFSEETFYKGIKKHKPTMTLSTISHWLYVVNHPDANKIDFSNMKYPISGGEKVHLETETTINEYLKKNGCKSRIIIGYGMCELGSTAVTNSKYHFKQGSPGYPITGVNVAAFDIETNEEMRYRERGEIRVFTPNRMKEYYKNPDATKEFFLKDSKGQEWGCTGDVGYVDEDGFVWVEGRATDYFITSTGKKIFNFDIEDVILEDEQVAQCEVIGIGSEGKGVPYAFVVGRTDEVNVGVILKRCKARLDEESIPVEIEILDKFPVKGSGKRDMEQLRQMAENNIKMHD